MENGQTNANNIIKQINNTIDYRRLLGSVLINWHWIALSVIVSLLIAFLYLRYTTPIYPISSRIMIEPKEVSAASNILTKFSSGANDPTNGNTDPNLFNEIYILTSQDLIATVVDSLDLNVQYFTEGRVNDEEVYETSPIKIVFDSAGYLGSTPFQFRIKGVNDEKFEIEEVISQHLSFNQWISRPYGRFMIQKSNRKEANMEYLKNHTPIIIKLTPFSNSTDATIAKLTVEVSDGRTSVLQLKYTDNLKKRGLDVMNTLIYFYRSKELENLNLSAERTREIIERYKMRFMDDLKSKDSLEADIKLKNNIVDIKAQAATVLAQKTSLEQQAEQLTLQKRAIAELKQNILYGAGARDEVIAGVVVKDEYLTALISGYNLLIQKAGSVERNTAPLNPSYLKLREDIDAQRKQIADACDRIAGSLSASLQNTVKNIDQSEVLMQTYPSTEIDMAESKREYPMLTEMYLYIYQRGIENDINQYATTNKSKIVVAPFVKDEPIKPVRNNIYAMMLAFGLMVPISIIFGKELLNNKIVNENDIDTITTMPIIGAISRSDGSSNNKHIVVGPNIRTTVAEQFRLIRANLEFISAGGNKKVYLITSSMSGEGKTFISLNLGLTMTMANKRVVIMEFDLRKPKFSNYLGLPTDGGISGYLAGIGGIASTIKPSGVHENLYVANCGPVPPNPGELLTLPTTQQLIEELSEMFDIVIIDTAPIGLVSDALVLSKFSDVNMFVVRQSYTLKEQLKFLNALYADHKVKNAGILFNGVEYLKQYGYGYGYGNSYSYQYGGGYYAQEPMKKKKKGVLNFLLNKQDA